jgi:hypothetical protein
MSVVARAVKRFLETPRPGIKRIDLQQWFESETGIDIDYSYFRVLVKKFGRKRTVRTGMVDCRLGDLPEVFIERAMWGICAENVIAVDEKPWLLRKVAPSSYWVGQGVATSELYKPLHKLLNASPIYMICAVAKGGVVIYALSDKPYTIPLFNQFLLRLALAMPADGFYRWVLMDNASFHAIDEETLEAMGEVSLGVTHTAPSTCALDPIEEFFGHCTHMLARKYARAVMETGRFVPIDGAGLRMLIVETVDEAGALDLTHIFCRANLPAETE